MTYCYKRRNISVRQNNRSAVCHIMKLVLLVASTFIVVAKGDGTEGSIKVLGTAECENPVDMVDIKLTSTYNSDTETMDGILETTKDITGDDIMRLDVHEKKGDDWVKNVKFFERDVCYIVENFLPIAWDKVRAVADPGIDDECFIPAGKYTFKDIALDKNDLQVPKQEKAVAKVDATLYQDDKPMFCTSLIVDVK